MDGALQACLGLLVPADGPQGGADRLMLPYAVESVRVLGGWTTRMLAWVREAPGSTSGLRKLDIDLCDEDGGVRVQMRAFSARLVDGALVDAAGDLAGDPGGDLAGDPGGAAGLLLAVPGWSAQAVSGAGFAGPRHVLLCGRLLCGLPQVAAALPGARCVRLEPPKDMPDGMPKDMPDGMPKDMPKDMPDGMPEDMPDGMAAVAAGYAAHALAVFAELQSLLAAPPSSPVLVQVVAEDALLLGLDGLLRTASAENPLLHCQMVLAEPGIDAATLGSRLAAEAGGDALVRWQDGVRSVRHWVEQDWPDQARLDQMGDVAPDAIALREDGVYLITGGLGGLGRIFAEEITRRTRSARVVLSGRGAADPALPDQAHPDQAHPDRAHSDRTGRVTYRQVDLQDSASVAALIAGVLASHGRLDGIVHAAGQTADNYLLRKDAAEMRAVLGPKVAGTVNLDLASRDVALDFLVLFASIAGALGNAGQGDYAAANGFMDQYAQLRTQLTAQGARHGRTLSIDWPLWDQGGMQLDAARRTLLHATTGGQALSTTAGLHAFHTALTHPAAQACTQLLVLQGNLPRLRKTLTKPARQIPPQTTVPAPVVASGNADDRLHDYLRQQLSTLIQLPASRIDVLAPLETYGIDSVMAMSLTRELEKTFGLLSKTLFFEHQSLAALGQHLLRSFPDLVRDRFSAVALSEPPAPVEAPKVARSTPRARQHVAVASAARVDIAIIGMAGRYPQAADLAAYWRNLRDGRDCVTEIPAVRWDNSRFYDPDRNAAGKSSGRWGGFLDDIDCFDPLFFGVSPKEAELMDPQERLFLEASWQAMEDAGYSRQSLAGRPIGVFVGVMWGHYELLGLEASLGGSGSVAGASHATIANRVSYVLNWHGPSMALDTMCSSSLTAMHLACESIRSGDCEAAIAGGVNLSLHPYKYLALSQGRFLSSDGRCRSFGEGGDGYVPGEGVGALLLKRLDHAQRDGDHVHAVIRASGINHGGKTNGYSVPNPTAQAALIRTVLARGGVDPATVSYIEAHGTGTSLGDPIEIAGLVNALGPTQDCPIGSVKSNIGHLESAAGVAAVTKVLLQMRHGELVPSLHATPANPYIDFAAAGLRVQAEAAPWHSPGTHPRRACVSSFGAGGANGHVVLDEAVMPAHGHAPAQSELFLLSARDPAALHRYAEAMLLSLAEWETHHLADIAFTSQLGRDAFACRLAIVAASRDDLALKLRRWLERSPAAPTDGLYQADSREFRSRLGDLVAGTAGMAFLEGLLRQRDLPRLAQLWTMGTNVDWTLMHRPSRPHRVALPTYPFARDRYWLPEAAAATDAPVRVRPAPVLEPVFYRPDWQDQPISGPAGRSGHAMLLLGGDDGLADALAAASTGSLVRVRWGELYACDGAGCFTLDPSREADLDRLFAALAESGPLPTRVLHCVPLSSDPGQLAEDCGRDAVLLLRLGQAYIRNGKPVAIVSLCESVAGEPVPHGAAIAGFLRSLAAENPLFTAATVELCACGFLSDQARAELLLAEFGALRGSVAAIRHLGGEARQKRQLRCLTTLQVPARALLPVKQGGTYLITGGLGGLGLIFAEHLARSAGVNLILVGRSELGPAQRAHLARLEGLGATARYVQADVADLPGLERAVAVARTEFGGLSGVIHAAGQTRDALVRNKSVADLTLVLTPKLAGTLALDQATRDETLDWFVLFSSVAAEIGNPGQCDYAFANGFQDGFAAQRELWRRLGSRHGHCLSINWPLWADGGMRVDPAALARVERESGVRALSSADGLRCWEQLLAACVPQALAMYGDPARVEALLRPGKAKAATVAVTAREAAPADLLGATEHYLQALIGAEVKLDAAMIDRGERFETYGVDSVMIARMNAEMARDLGPLPQTLFYEHETVADLARHLLAEAAPALAQLLARPDEVLAAPTHHEPAALPARRTTTPMAQDAPIAIIGMHGLYPHSPDLDAYWRNLSLGRDLIDAIPAERWSSDAYFDPDPDAASRGKIYCKWGGFLDKVDAFDPAFFNLTAEEACSIDPQERLFLQSVWSAFEDAGTSREALRRSHPKGRGAAVGVFVGVTTSTYQLIEAENGETQPTNLPWSIANRVSYFFNFEGPSMPVDTACSSSLVALHLASESLRSGACEIAVAGGVNLYLHPAKYQSLCRRQMVSADGKCRSYGAGGDGFVPGEGIGTLILKPLARALDDGDQIHGVIRASAYAHSGRSNGYSAPNPNAQANLIDEVLRRAGCTAQTISYVEGHGTGTALGDSIEVAALTQAFRRQPAWSETCALGSVKSNIGHGESAAGIAAITKVLLQMRHGQMAPSLHAETINPNIDLGASPFHLQRSLAAWPRSAAHPRRALVNSFGAGGVNACVVIEQHEPAPASAPTYPPLLLVLSARSEERLHRHGERLLAHLRAHTDLDLGGVCCSLQLGREAMTERLAVFADDGETLLERLSVWLYGGRVEGVLRGTASRRPAAPPMPIADPAATLPDRLRDAAAAWVQGGAVDWRSFYGETLPARPRLPSYPFAENRYWPTSRTTTPSAPGSARLHPLVSHNASTLTQVRFSSPLSERAYYATDHQVGGARIFPGAGFIEIALACGTLAAETRATGLRDLVWSHPLSFDDGPQALRTSLRVADHGAEFAIGSLGIDNEPVLHCEGRLVYEQIGSAKAAGAESAAPMDLDALRRGCGEQIDRRALYERFSANGLDYAAAFQAMESLSVCDGMAIAHLVLPEPLRADFPAYTLHPSIVDGAMQGVAALMAGKGGPHLPFALNALTVLRPLPFDCWAVIESDQGPASVKARRRSFTIRLVNARGDVLVRLDGLHVRPLLEETQPMFDELMVSLP